MIRDFDTIVKFYTPSGIYIDSFNMQGTNPYAMQLKITDEKIGGLKDFSITIQRDVTIRMFNQMFVEFWINQNRWYTGIVNFLPEVDQKKDDIEIQGNGLYSQLQDQVMSHTYNNKTPQEIIDDIFTNQIFGKTDVLYSIANINPPAITLTTFEANDKKVASVLENLMEICNVNFNAAEYICYVHSDKYIYFEEMEKATLKRNFFEGSDFQDPKVKIKTNKLINAIDIFITDAVSQTVAYSSTVNDTDSIAYYGESKQKLTIPSNMDSDTGENIANYRIEKWKNPKKTIKLKDLKIEEEPFPFGLYGITTRHELNRFVVDECNTLDTWTYNLAGSSIFIDDAIMMSGRNSFRWEVTSYDSDYIQFEFDEPLWFWEDLILWIRPEDWECEYQVYVEDSDGNSLNSDYFILEVNDLNPDYLMLENGTDYFTTNSIRSVFRNVVIEIIHDNRNIALENNDLFVLENGVDELVIDGLEVVLNKMVLGDFNPVSIPNGNQIYNIKKIKIASVGAGTTSYLDRIEVIGRMFSTSKLTMEKIRYSTDNNQILADADFGEIEENAVDKIKEIKETQTSIFSIFEKH